jgi:hypothetical protein
MRADLIARDREGRPVLVVEVKTRPVGQDDIMELLGRLHTHTTGSASGIIPYGMLVDPESIVVLPHDSPIPDKAFGPYPTSEVLRHYDPDFTGPEDRRGSQRVFGIYLQGLVEGGLEDLVLPWKEGEPPLKNELAKAGLLQRLEGGSVAKEELIRDDSLR